MNTSTVETLPKVEHVETTGGRLTVHLEDGRTLSVPLSWYPRLAHATPEERANWEVFAEGTAVEWPDVDEHVGVDGLLAGRRSQESERSFLKWKASRRRTAPTAGSTSQEDRSV